MKYHWVSAMFCDGLKRHRLFIDGEPSPYFIDEALHIHHRTYGHKYGLWGAGMGEMTRAGYRIAGVLGWFDKLSDAKKHALSIAAA